MNLNFVPCVAWVARGIAASNPEKLQLSPEELKRLVNEAKGQVSQSIEEEDDSDVADNDEEESIENEDEIVEEKDSADEEDDFDTRYNLDSYDNNDDDNPLFTINDIAVHVDNHDDEYVTDQESEGDLEEKEDFAIKDSDNLLLVGHVEESSSVLEIHIYNHEEDSFYVHHDIVLPAYPLAIEWLDFHPSEEKPGNYAAIGDMTPVIKIWDLDVVDVLEPDYELGINPEKKKSKKLKKKDAKYHSDAVLSLSWNKLVKNLLASGSADSSVIIWDLEDGSGLNQLSFHSNKVQTLQWHPSESPILLSGCTDGFVKLYDCRSDSESKSWKVEGEIERVLWNIRDSFKFFFSTDQGYIYSVDMRKNEIEHSFKAHKEPVTGLDISPLKPEILISASMDRTLKVWDINSFQMMKSMKLKVGSIFTAKAAPDLDHTVAVGGNYSSNSLKVVTLFEEAKKSEELNEAEQSEEMNLNKVKKEKDYGLNFPNASFQQSEENNFFTKKKKKNYDSNNSQESNFSHLSLKQNDVKNSIKKEKKEKKKYVSNDSQSSNFTNSGSTEWRK